ncbi:MAG: biopolymer transporter ExbD [Salinivirgaceae bacterium]|nr:biopolymer transporter ExbD [Salinivirgaceae bacterium]
MPKKLPEYNASSLADIAFMLLIFFLVTTTMGTDLGILKMLSPPAPENQPQEDKVRERNIFVVLINKNDLLLVEGKPMDINNLKDEAKKFIQNPNRDINLPEFKAAVDVPFFGPTEISKQIISLQNDRGTSYGIYIQALNELTAAYVEVKNELAMRKFGKVYDDLDEDRQNAIRKIFPQRISEAEPKNYGGK